MTATEGKGQDYIKTWFWQSVRLSTKSSLRKHLAPGSSGWSQSLKNSNIISIVFKSIKNGKPFFVILLSRIPNSILRLPSGEAVSASWLMREKRPLIRHAYGMPPSPRRRLFFLGKKDRSLHLWQRLWCGYSSKRVWIGKNWVVWLKVGLSASYFKTILRFPWDAVKKRLLPISDRTLFELRLFLAEFWLSCWSLYFCF